MAITVQKLSELTDAEVEAAHNAIVQLVKENNPSVDVKRGVIHDLVVHMSALLGAAKDKEIERLRRSMSIKTILEDPALSDTDIVDAVLSNYRITRGASAAATGDVTIIVNKQSALTLPANTLFTVGGTTFSLASGGVSVRTSSAQVTAASDRVLEPVQNGLYAFSVPVVASSAGLIADVKRGNTVIVSPTPLHFSSAHASNDFTSGTNAETNAELMVRFQEGIAAQAWSNRTNITSMIKSNATFSSVSDTSIIGMSDAEMVRDQHSILPISLPGRTDIYVRSAQTLATTTKQITATFVEEITNSTTGACVGGKWQFGLGRTEIPGFYEVTRAALTTAAATDTGYEAVSIVRDFDLGDDDFIPDINTAKEAAFSKYQTAIVQILDTDTDVSSAVAGSTQQSYDITFSHMPLIAELQDFCGGRDVRNPAGDVLVKGAIPCFLSLNFTVRKSATEAAPNLDAIREALAIEVNSLGFSGHLHASRISDLVFGYLSSTSAVSNIDMFGRILSPEGSNIYIRSGDVLEIPNRTDDFVSPRTVVFILERNDIGITVENM